MLFRLFRKGRPEASPKADGDPRRIVVGLGNPGPKYAQTRHNAGFLCVDNLAKAHGISLSHRRSQATLGEGEIDGLRITVAKPRTFMNQSGQGIRYLLDYYRAKPEDLVIIYDDMDLPLGALRIRPKGSAGGHRGMQSIIASIGTEEFPRVRVGIGRPSEEADEIAYVLGRFSREERQVMEKAFGRVAEAVACLLTQGIDEAMNRYN